MSVDKRIIIQGIEGCFHQEAAQKFFNTPEVDTVPADSFDELADILQRHEADHMAIMAIENSIAGSLLQNYRILREREFSVVGEVYLRIKHNLMAIAGQSIADIREVSSHPMAINQCLEYFVQYPEIKLVKSEDTALAARQISEKAALGIGAIASESAAQIYGLDILGKGIETSKENYTRFFIIQGKNQKCEFDPLYNKASIYIRVQDRPGCLLKAMDIIAEHHINISKLQSYPVLGVLNEYYFYLDLEFAEAGQYEAVMELLPAVTSQLRELGTYQKASIYDHQAII